MSNVIHQEKQCQILIKKPKVKIFNWYAMVMGAMRIAKIQKRDTPFTIDSLVAYLYDETYKKYSRYITSDLGELNKIKDNFTQKHKILYDSDPINFVYSFSEESKGQNPLMIKRALSDYYYIVSDNGFKADSLEQPVSASVGRVLSCNVEQKVDSIWTASVELDNAEDYFLLKDTSFDSSIDFAENECIIEANDEIIIFTSNNEGHLKKIFTGYVGIVTVSDDGLNKRVNLNCQDITKKLVMDRIMIEPSLTPWTNEGNSITPFTNILIPMPPADIVARLLYMTYSQYYSHPDFIIAMNNALIAANNVQGVENIEKLADALKTVQSVISSLFNRYVVTEYELDDNGNPIIYTAPNGTVYPKILGFKGYKQDNEYKQYDKNKRELIFDISNLDQPVWQWQFNDGNYNIFTSAYRTHNEVISDIAKAVFYEFYADVNGIIRFCPTNLSFPSRITNEEAIDPGKEFVDGIGKLPNIYNVIMRNYNIMREDEAYITSMQETNTDLGIYTDLSVTGSFKTVTGEFPYLKSENVANWDLRAKYGIRMAGHENRVGYQTVESIESYGRSRLLRLNAQHWTATIQMHGNSDIFPGMPLFVERWLAIYYITSVKHSFTTGQSYTMSLGLTYKRVPIAKEIDNKNSKLEYTALTNWLKRKLENNIIYNDFADLIWDNRAFLTWGKIKEPGEKGATYWLVWNYIATDFRPHLEYLPTLLKKQDIVKNAIVKPTKKNKTAPDSKQTKKSVVNLPPLDGGNMTESLINTQNTNSELTNKLKAREQIINSTNGELLPSTKVVPITVILPIQIVRPLL